MRDNKEFLEEIKVLSGEDVFNCYQCGKCSAGCPTAKQMSILPHMVIRRLQLCQKSEILQEDSMWKCASCMTCASRCPRKISLCNIMEALRIMYMKEFKDNKYQVEEIPREILSSAPQQAVIAGFRKYTY